MSINRDFISTIYVWYIHRMSYLTEGILPMFGLPCCKFADLLIPNWIFSSLEIFWCLHSGKRFHKKLWKDPPCYFHGNITTTQCISTGPFSTTVSNYVLFFPEGTSTSTFFQTSMDFRTTRPPWPPWVRLGDPGLGRGDVDSAGGRVRDASGGGVSWGPRRGGSFSHIWVCLKMLG